MPGNSRYLTELKIHLIAVSHPVQGCGMPLGKIHDMEIIPYTHTIRRNGPHRRWSAQKKSSSIFAGFVTSTS